MKVKRIRKELLAFRQKLEEAGVKPREYRVSGALADHAQLRSHALWLLQQLEPRLVRGHEREANRLFGTVQGMLFATGTLRIDQITSHLIDDEQDEEE